MNCELAFSECKHADYTESAPDIPEDFSLEAAQTVVSCRFAVDLGLGASPGTKREVNARYMVIILTAIASQDGLHSVFRAIPMREPVPDVSLPHPVSREFFKAINVSRQVQELRGKVRRLSLASTAKLYDDASRNGGYIPQWYYLGSNFACGRTMPHVDQADPSGRDISPTQRSRTAAYRSIMHFLWAMPFPPATKLAQIRWKSQMAILRKRIERGKRWLAIAEQFGWSVICVIAKDWLGPSLGTFTDTMFERELSQEEFTQLMAMIEDTRGDALRRFERRYGQLVLGLISGSASDP